MWLWVGDGYRVTVRRSIRRIVPLKIGQKVALVPFGDRVIVQPLPDKPEEKLAELTKGEFDKQALRKASKFLISQAKR